MSHAALSHAVNGFFDHFRSTAASPQAAEPPSRASRVRVESRYNEGDDESLLESATSLPRPTLKALEKAIRADGFRGALVSGWGQGERGGFTVRYGGEEFEFEISENVEPRSVGELGRLVKASGRYESNPMLKESDKRVIRAFVNEKAASSNLLETDGIKLDKIGLGGETVAFWHQGRIAIVSTESVKSDESIIRAIIKDAGPGVVDYSYARKGHRTHSFGAPGRMPRHETNGRGIYHGTAAGKHDMVLVPGHRGRWRIDLVTSAGGTHTDVTGPNAGYATAEEAFQAALDVQHVRGIRGKSHVWIADHEGNMADYEPMEANGRHADPFQEDDYVIGNVNRDAEIGLFRIIRGGKFLGPIEKSANIDTIVHAMETDARERGTHAAAVFEMRDDGGYTQVGNVVNGRYQESGAYSPNARGTVADPDAASELDLYIANTYELVAAPNSIGKSIDANLQRKLAAGKYDSALAPKAWQYLVDEGAKRYAREIGPEPTFNAATRRQVAADFARAWEEENMRQTALAPINPATAATGYYVSAMMGNKRALASGPYDSRAAAEAAVGTVSRAWADAQPETWHAAWGVAHVKA